MSVHIIPNNMPNEASDWIFYLDEQEMPILTFLRKNSKTISLSTKLHIMSQICSFLQYLHKQGIAYFIEPENIFVTKGIEVKIRGFYRSYEVMKWE